MSSQLGRNATRFSAAVRMDSSLLRSPWHDCRKRTADISSMPSSACAVTRMTSTGSARRSGIRKSHGTYRSVKRCANRVHSLQLQARRSWATTAMAMEHIHHFWTVRDPQAAPELSVKSAFLRTLRLGCGRLVPKISGQHKWCRSSIIYAGPA